MRTAFLAALISVATATSARAQGDTSVACATYRLCALRVEQSVFSMRLVQGQQGTPVGTLGWFGSGVSLLRPRQDSAGYYARRYVRHHRWASALGVIGGIAAVFALERSGDGFRLDTDDNTTLIALGVSAASALASIPFVIGAQRSLSRSIWWYNSTLAFD